LSARWLLDNSAWARRADPRVPQESRARLADDLESGLLIVSLPFLMEAGYSVRDAAERDRLFHLFGTLESVGFDRSAEQRSLDAQAQLARTGHHRIPPVDILIASLADNIEVGVLHYNAHYDLILERTDLSYDSRWLSPRGTL
jgi:predicted nucleic acid-binding protein